jgi:hypothetical protein
MASRSSRADRRADPVRLPRGDGGFPNVTGITQLPRQATYVQEAKIGPDKNNPDIPHVSAPTIIKYVTDLQLLGLL